MTLSTKCEFTKSFLLREGIQDYPVHAQTCLFLCNLHYEMTISCRHVTLVINTKCNGSEKLTFIKPGFFNEVSKVNIPVQDKPHETRIVFIN